MNASVCKCGNWEAEWRWGTQRSNPCRTKCKRWIELNLLAQLPFLSLPFNEKTNGKAMRQRAACAPVSLSLNLLAGLWDSARVSYFKGEYIYVVNVNVKSQMQIENLRTWQIML